jgi:hypothetical protein
MTYELLIRPTDNPADNRVTTGDLGAVMSALEAWLADNRGRGIAFLFDLGPRGDGERRETLASITHPSRYAK